MLNKIYDKIKKIIKNNLGFFIVLISIFLLFNIKLPYYIVAPGSLINLENRTSINYELRGSYNMTYVSEYECNIFNYVLSFIIPHWDLEKKEEVILKNETKEESDKRGHILLKEGNQISIINAYRLANKNLTIYSNKLYITYIDEIADTNLKIGDQILKIDNITINSLDDIANILKNKNYNEILKIETNNGMKEAKIINYQNEKKIGILLSNIYDLDTDIEFKFKNNESGSSGGLMTTLYLYNYFIDDDLTKGKVISGTGTIDISGNIGEISGVKYKLIGAVKEKADIFLVPYENYEEAIKVKNENNYNIDIVSVKTIDEALEYLKNN